MEDVLKSKKSNIGALCGFLKSAKNKKYLDYIEERIIDLSEYNLSLSEKLYYYFNDIKDPLLCGCGDHLKFIGFKNGYRTSCGKKECYVKQRKETNLRKYGVDNPQKCDKIKQKTQKSIKEKYNGKHYMYDEKVRNKFKSTMKDKYGVEWAQQNSQIKSKSLKTWGKNSVDFKEKVSLKRSESISNAWNENKDDIIQKRKNSLINKYGSLGEYYEHFNQKVKETSLKKYGQEHFLKNDDIIAKRVKSYKASILGKIKECLNSEYKYLSKKNNKNNTDSYIKVLHRKCNNEFDITRQLLFKRNSEENEICLHCNPVSIGYSKSEKEVLKFIKSNYNGDILENEKVYGVECDIYLPQLNLGFEYDGLYWHSELYKEKNFHLNKTEIFENNNIQLIHIFEDEWVHKREIIESRILNILGKSKKVYGRECEVKEINENNLIRNFLNESHLQGFVGSKIKLGLFYKGELVSIMTFGSLRRNLGQRAEEGSYELLRFCNKLNTVVIGGASKIFKYFINNYNPKYVISYADRRWSQGNMYEKLGFEFSHNSDPNYFYIDKLSCIRLNRFNFRKDKLVAEGYDSKMTEKEIMFNRGFYRIYDCGSKKYEILFK